MQLYLIKKFKVRYQDITISTYSINSGIPQSMFGSILYLIYTADILIFSKAITATFINTVILASMMILPKPLKIYII